MPGAVAKHFGKDVEYAVIIKEYMPPPTTPEAKRRYSPNKVIGTTVAVVQGTPDSQHTTTSHVERANLTMRMGMRRFTRLTNAFTKRIEMHMHAVSLHFMHYNFACIHKSLKVAPAMGVSFDSPFGAGSRIVRVCARP